jgi:hypothetical protein
LGHHSKTIGVSPQNRRFYFEVRNSISLRPTYIYIGERRTTFAKAYRIKAKAYGIKVRWYWELFEEHVRNLGILHFHPAPPYSRRPSLDDPTSHWLHGNSIPKIGWHCFWPGLIALPKNTVPIKLNQMGNRPHQKRNFGFPLRSRAHQIIHPSQFWKSSTRNCGNLC